MTSDAAVVIRRAEPRDASALGLLGAQLVRAHHAFDAQRFLSPDPRLEQGYGSFLHTQMADPDVAVFVAERSGEVVGYVYAGIEPYSWKELRERAGFIHDIVVAAAEQSGGIGSRLIETASEWLVAQKVPRVLLWTAAKNEHAQRLFERHGFRRTLIEMTREA